MSITYAKLDQALKDLIEAYGELEEELEEKHGEDEEAYSHAVIEAVETSIESALEEHDYSTANFAGLLSVLTESLEQIDPAAFEEEGEFGLANVDYEIEEAEIDDADLDDEDEVDLDEEDDDDSDDDE